MGILTCGGPELWPALVPAALLLASGCGDNDEGGSSSFGGTEGTSVTASGSDSGSSGSASASSNGTTVSTSADGSSGEQPKFDVGTGVDVPGNCMAGDPGCGCTAVDILFIVDNSGSMQEHAAPTVAAFDTFVNEMIDALPPGTSLHVGVTRATGFYDPGNGGGWGGPGCEAALTDGVWNPPDVADNGVNGQQGRLFEHMGVRFYDIETDADPTPLKTWFQGALMGAIDGSAEHSNTETVVAGAAYPFHPANADYNQDFMRQQAVLVLFLLSDSPDLSPPDIPTQDFVDIVSDAKSECGDMCVITTGAIAGQCYDQPGNINTRLYDFMNGFGAPPPSWINLQFGMVPDFTGVLGTALADVIGSTCANIPPAG